MQYLLDNLTAGNVAFVVIMLGFVLYVMFYDEYQEPVVNAPAVVAPPAGPAVLPLPPADMYTPSPALHQWYAQATTKHREKVKGIRWFTWANMAPLLVTLLSIVLVAIIYEEAPEGALLKYAGFMLMAFLFLRVVPLFIMYSSAQRNVEKDFRGFQQASKPVPSTSLPAVWKAVRALQQDMDLTSYTLNLYFVPQDRALPFVYTDQQAISLFLPRTTAYLALLDPAAFRALIAHEFGHVKQGDGKAHLVQVHWARKQLTYATFIGASTFLIGLGFGKLDIPYISFLATNYLANSNKRRRKMELMADAATLLYASPQAMVRVLRTYTAPTADLRAYYPPVEERINSLNTRLSTYQTAAAVV